MNFTWSDLWNTIIFTNDSLFVIVIPVILVLAVSILLFAVIKITAKRHASNQAPRLMTDAALLSKRTHATRRPNKDSSFDAVAYYLTFEVPSGDQIEFCVSKTDYETFNEGDFGSLWFQGTRFLGFRKKTVLSPPIS